VDPRPVPCGGSSILEPVVHDDPRERPTVRRQGQYTGERRERCTYGITDSRVPASLPRRPPGLVPPPSASVSVPPSSRSAPVPSPMISCPAAPQTQAWPPKVEDLGGVPPQGMDVAQPSPRCAPRSNRRTPLSSRGEGTHAQLGHRDGQPVSHNSRAGSRLALSSSVERPCQDNAGPPARDAQCGRAVHVGDARPDRLRCSVVLQSLLPSSAKQKTAQPHVTRTRPHAAVRLSFPRGPVTCRSCLATGVAFLGYATNNPS
jgi:hypothetical protein